MFSVGYKIYKLSSNSLVVLSLLKVISFINFGDLFFVVSDNAPLYCLLFAFKLADHFLGCLHLLAALIKFNI
jgi:hypothetical protein